MSLVHNLVMSCWRCIALVWLMMSMGCILLKWSGHKSFYELHSCAQKLEMWNHISQNGFSLELGSPDKTWIKTVIFYDDYLHQI